MDLEPKPTELTAKPRRSMHLRSRSKYTPPTPDQSRRQSNVVQSAWRHFGQRDLAIAFLNTRHDGLEGQPLHLAIESEHGLDRVERLLKQMTLEA